MPKTRKRLKVLRAEQELSQWNVADRCGMSRSRYQQIESGVGSVPRDEEKTAIAIALRVNVSAIAWPYGQEEMSA